MIGPQRLIPQKERERDEEEWRVVAHFLQWETRKNSMREESDGVGCSSGFLLLLWFFSSTKNSSNNSNTNTNTRECDWDLVVVGGVVLHSLGFFHDYGEEEKEEEEE